MGKNGRPKLLYRAVCLACCALTVLSVPVAAENTAISEESGAFVFESNKDSYFGYYNTYAGESRSSSEIVLNGENALNIDGHLKSVGEYSGIEVGGKDFEAKWHFTAPESGLYSLCLDYYTIEGKSNELTFSFTLDGKSPYTEAKSFTAPRAWSDERGKDEFEKDSLGNDRLPTQKEIFHASEKWITNLQGMYEEPYLFYITAGEHTVEISSVDDVFIVGKLTLGTPKQVVSYEEYLKANADRKDETEEETVLIEAALTEEKSSSDLYPLSDRTNSATKPNSPGKTLLNTVGGSNWCYTGDSITWKLNVPKSGWYGIYMRQRQNINQGLNSYRTLQIDGQIPFKEAESLCFEYEMKWQVKALGEDKPYRFYLTEGEHTLTLTCAAGPTAEPLRELNQAILDLNSVYRKIIMVTGTSPDVYRDYNLDTTVEGLIPGLKDLSERLVGIADKIEKIVGTRQSQISVLDEMADMLSSMAKTSYTIPTRLANYKSKVESIGSLLLSMTQQPLTIDYIELVPEKGTASNGKISFFEKLFFSVASLASSFTEDYNVLNTVEEGKTPIETWVSSGRDQVKIISQIVNDFFVTKTGIPVKLSIVDTSTTLVEATLAGKGPDVALLMPQDTPVNLASRDALVDLSKFNLGELKNEIYEQSFNPFRYNGGLYALPESETFNMLFYRTDVFEQLGLSVPETWDEFYEVMNVLRFNNLEVGIPEVNTLNRGVSLAINFFETLLYQNGVSLFNENLTATALDTETAYSMFERCTELYTDYGLDQEFNFFNRFRAGEMAMAIEAYSAYNQITAAAPELNGLWSFAPIPGTVGEDGKLNRSAVGTVTGCIMLKSAEKKGIENDAWEFISWWVNGDTQGYYANMLESVMGVLGRYTPANHEAFSQMRWTSNEAALIDEQWESVVLMPEIPGGYYVNRSLTSAIRNVISKHNSPRRELALYNRDINNEITRKRKEFGLSYEGEEK